MNWSILLKVMQLVSDRAWLLVCWTQAQSLTSLRNEIVEYVHLPFSSFCFCSVHQIYLRAWPYMDIPGGQNRYSEGVSLLEDPNTAVHFCTYQEVKVLLLRLDFSAIWLIGSCHGEWPSIIHTIFFFDWCGRRAKFRVLIPSTSCEAPPHSVMLIMIPPRPVQINCSGWITKYLICV